MEKIRIIYIYLQSLSIDIVLGACAGMLFFDRLIEADLNISLYILLGLAVWCTYTFDHLLDARQIGKEASTFRHAFHQKKFKMLSLFLVFAGIFGIVFAFFLLRTSPIFIFGLSLGGLIWLIFILLKDKAHNWAYLKEISIGTLYVGGIMLAPFFHMDPLEIPTSFWSLGIAYILVAWFNTVYFGILDKESDQEDGLNSLTLAIGEPRSRKILYLLLIIMLGYIISLYLWLNSFAYFHISIILIIALIHAKAFLQGDQHKDETRRALDASFMLPFLLFLV